jgi:hypothetical protein
MSVTATATSTVKLIKDCGTTEDIQYSLSPKEAITSAVHQIVFKNLNTWDYDKKHIELIETPISYMYQFGDNSALWVRK